MKKGLMIALIFFGPSALFADELGVKGPTPQYSKGPVIVLTSTDFEKITLDKSKQMIDRLVPAEKLIAISSRPQGILQGLRGEFFTIKTGSFSIDKIFNSIRSDINMIIKDSAIQSLAIQAIQFRLSELANQANKFYDRKKTTQAQKIKTIFNRLNNAFKSIAAMLEKQKSIAEMLEKQPKITEA